MQLSFKLKTVNIKKVHCTDMEMQVKKLLRF